MMEVDSKIPKHLWRTIQKHKCIEVLDHTCNQVFETKPKHYSLKCKEIEHTHTYLYWGLFTPYALGKCMIRNDVGVSLTYQYK